MKSSHTLFAFDYRYRPTSTISLYGRVAGGKTPSRGKTPTQDIRGTGRNPVKCLLTISVGEWPEFVYIFGATR